MTSVTFLITASCTEIFKDAEDSTSISFCTVTTIVKFPEEANEIESVRVSCNERTIF